MTKGPGLPPLFDSETISTGVTGPYQETDRRIIDYGQVRLAGHAFRGPLVDTVHGSRRIAFLGAAQTFGRFVRVPFPDLLGSLTGRDVLNLGYAGAGASFYLAKPRLLSLAAGSALSVVQVMSGRSAENSLFSCPDGRNTLVRRSDGARMTDGPAYRWVLDALGPERAIALARENQRRWVEETTALAAALAGRKVLFWFSVRAPEFEPRGDNVKALMGAFPHFVSREMVEEVAPHFDAYVECTSARGLPQPLRDRHSGAPVEVGFAGARRTENVYYPSPAMHLDAAAALEGPVRTLLDGAEGRAP